MSTARVVSPEVLLPAAAALRDVAEQLDGAAADIHGCGRTALDGAGQFAGALAEGAAVLSLSWSSAAAHAGRSAGVVADVATQAVAFLDALDAQAAQALRAGGRGR